MLSSKSVLFQIVIGIYFRYPFSEETIGIAYDSISNKIFVTGKLWPQLYEISFSH
jgi:glutamine cyclotransferase